MVNVANSTEEAQSYYITIGVSDTAGAVGTVYANVTALAPAKPPPCPG